MSLLHPRTHDVLISAWRENRLAAIHIDIQPDFEISPMLCRSINRLADSLRDLSVANIWVAYGDEPDQNKVTTVGDVEAAKFDSGAIMPFAGAQDEEIAIVKTQASAFHFPTWPLHTHLQENNKDTILVTGVHHDCCVGHTIEDGILSNLYNIVAVYDCIDLPEGSGPEIYARKFPNNCANRAEALRIYNVSRQQIAEQYQDRFHLATAPLILEALTEEKGPS